MPQPLSRCNLKGQTYQTIRNQRLHPQEPAQSGTCTKLPETKCNWNLLATSQQDSVASRSGQEPKLGQDKPARTDKNWRLWLQVGWITS